MAKAQVNAEELQTKLSEITAANVELTKFQAESEALRQQLAEAKMDNVELEAGIDAIRSQKPDTSAADALKKELDDVKQQSLADIELLRVEKAQLLEEKKTAALDHEGIVKKHAADLKAATDGADDSTKEVANLQNELQTRVASLEKLQAEIANIMQDNDISKKEFEAHQNETIAKVQRHEADYNDMYESMTAMVMEEQRKRNDLEQQIKDSSEKLQEAEKVRSRFAELEAQLRVKDAEIAEVKVCFQRSHHPNDIRLTTLS